MSRLKTTAALAVFILLIGCATEVAHHTFLSGARAPKPENHPIDIYTNSVPTRPYDRVAVLDVHCEAQAFMEPNLKNDGLPKLISQARKAGCDAIMDIEARRPDNWTFETKAIHYTATGIAYK